MRFTVGALTRIRVRAILVPPLIHSLLCLNTVYFFKFLPRACLLETSDAAVDPM